MEASLGGYTLHYGPLRVVDKKMRVGIRPGCLMMHVTKYMVLVK